MTMSNQQLLVLRDGEGNYYLISGDALDKARVPADKQQAVEQALQSAGGDVSGFGLFGPNFNVKTTFANLNQANTQVGTNVIAGSLVAGPVVQAVSNTGVNAAQVG